MENQKKSFSKILFNSKNKKGFLYSLGATILISANFITVKYSLRGFDPVTFSFIWSLSAALFTLIFIYFPKHGKNLKLKKDNRISIIILGVLAGISTLLAWAGLSLLDTSFSAFLWRFLPLLSIILGIIFLKEKLLKGEIWPIALMVIGGGLSTIGRWEVVGMGVLLTLAACLGSAFQLLIAKVKATDLPTSLLSFYRNLIGAMVILCWILISGKGNFSAECKYWVVAILGAFIGPGLGVYMTFKAYQYWNLSRSSIITTLQPLFVIPLAYTFLNTFPSKQEFLGGLIILLGCLWLSWIHLENSFQNLD